jgi:uncharacterized protein
VWYKDPLTPPFLTFLDAGHQRTTRGAMAKRLVILGIFPIVLATRCFSGEVPAQSACRVMDPTGTPLNVRTSPNGNAVGSLENGVQVVILDSASRNGKNWVYVGRTEDRVPIGWVFQDYLVCHTAGGIDTTALGQNGPSFDCSRATFADERSICGNPRLSELDRLVAAGYQYVRQRYGDDEAKQIARPILSSRHACGADDACIEEKQLAAIKQYQSLGAPLASIAPSAQPPTPSVNVSNDSSHTTVLLKDDGGTFVVPVEINGAITLDFIIDSGASDVSVPADVVSTLIRTGTITDADFIGSATYTLADGSKTPSDAFNIRSLKLGNEVIRNVRGVISPPQGSLLLGQSFLRNFKSWSIDNVKHALVVEKD